MCGIFCALSATRPILPDDDLQQRLQKRGPDSICTVKTTFPKPAAQELDSSAPNVYITFCSTVLSLRGSQTVTQPYQDSDETYTLCWNGEAWSIGDHPTSGNDTEAVHQLLLSSLKPSLRQEDALDEPLKSASEVAKALSRVAGPYADV